MKIKGLFLSVICIACLASCAPTKFVAQTSEPLQISEMALLQPIAEVSIVAPKGDLEYSESMSITEAGILQNALMSNTDKVPVSQLIEINHEQGQLVYDAVSYAETNVKRLQGFKIPSEIVSLVRSSGQRYGLLVVADGISKSQQNYRTELIVGVITSILSLGTIYMIPVKAASKINAIIFDSTTGEVVYFKTSGEQQIDPLDEKDLTRASIKLFKNFTWQ